MDQNRICPRQIHALFTETGLANQLNSVEALLAHPGIQCFVERLKTKPVDLIDRTRKSQKLKTK